MSNYEIQQQQSRPVADNRSQTWISDTACYCRECSPEDHGDE